MDRKLLRYRVIDGVLRMREGEETTVGKVATVEKVSKSPQLYMILQEMINEGFLRREYREHSNKHVMHVFIRTSKEDPQRMLPFGSEN